MSSCWWFLAACRQDFGHFETSDGVTTGFQSHHRCDSQMQRIKEQGVVSHFLAQRRSLLSWLGDREPQHGLVVRIFDDTNVWVAPQKKRVSSTDAEAREDGQADSDHETAPAPGLDISSAGDNSQKPKVGPDVARLGKRKVSPLLGMIQRIFIRRKPREGVADLLESAQVHVPSQVLPKASWHASHTKADL